MRTGTDVRFMSSGDPNGRMIEEFLRKEFPQSVSQLTDPIEAVVAAIVGSRQVRLGAAPNPESMEAIRRVVRAHVGGDRPIPVLVAAGPKKPWPGSVDVAELSGMKTLAQLQDAVVPHHPPGLEIRVRIEDLTGLVLEGKEIAGAEQYIADLVAMVGILGYSDFIIPVRERDLADTAAFVAAVDEVHAAMMPYLAGTNGTEADMIGWAVSAFMSSPITAEQRAFFMGRYAKLYPGGPEDAHMWAMSRYLSCAVARRMLGASGTKDSWDSGKIDISFAPPVPGTPKDLVSTRVYYRTVPLAHSKQHIPFWRARGILKAKGDEVRTSFAARDEAGIVDGNVELRSGDNAVTIKADYMVES